MGKRTDRGAVVVNGYSERWLRQGFPWIYPKERLSGPTKGGVWVSVKSSAGEPLGAGITDQGWIAVRMFKPEGGHLDQAWLDALLDKALAYRQMIIPPDTTAYRIVHGENDGLPGIRVDWWDHFATIVLDSPALAMLLPMVCHWLEDRLHPRGVYLCYRLDFRDERSRTDLQPPPGLIVGHAPVGDVTVRERGLSYLVRPNEGPDVGLYCDMRSVRAWIEPYWGGRRVLNTFAYTGAFSVAAAYAGAAEVVTVDLAQPVLDRARANFVANDLDPEDYEFVAADTIKALDRFRRTGQRFDWVILDPPSFSHHGGAVWSAKKDYPRLVTAAARVMEPGAFLMAATNQGQVSPKDFRAAVSQGLRRAGCRAQEVYWAGAAPDFPAGTWFPEGHYLKVGIWHLC
jgi:23S rRNA (cytosine1962-C5)-methyltransferase